jgi:predicted nucleotidyltransferase
MTKLATALIPLIEERTGLDQQEIASFCRHWQITEMALFGSVLRSDFNSNSDIDILLRFAPHARQGLLTLGKKLDKVGQPSIQQADCKTNGSTQ